MRLWVVFAGMFGCSDYRISKATSASGEGESLTISDTAEPGLDTGETNDAPIDSEEDEPPAEDEPLVDPPSEKVYVHTGQTLYSWDPGESTLSIIGDFYRTDDGDIEEITDIAIDGAGRFYGVSYGMLYGIDGSTAEIWPISPIDFPLYGLTCTFEGRLIGGGDGLFEINPATGVATTLVPAGRYQTSGDLVGLPDGLLYWAVRDGDDLVVVDPTSGVAIARGEIGVQEIYGLGYADGSLFGFTDAGQAIEIDPSDGQILSTTMLPGRWWGATTNPTVW